MADDRKRDTDKETKPARMPTNVLLKPLRQPAMKRVQK